MKFSKSIRAYLIPIASLALVLLFVQATDFLTELQEKYARFVEKNPSVRLHLTFHQPAYAIADTVYLSAWYVDDNHRPVKGDHIVTVDIVGGDNLTYQRVRFKLQNGRGNNQFEITESLPPGLYKIVAYTGWMKNFGLSWMFQQSMVITGRNQVKATGAIETRFLAEGGNLVPGIENRLVGMGPAGTEWVIEDGAAEVSRMVLDSTGVGAITLVPQAGQNYTARNTTLKRTIPISLSTEAVIIRLGSDFKSVELALPPSSPLAGEKLYVANLSKGRIIFQNEVAVAGGSVSQIAMPNAEPGLNQFFVFNSKGNVVAQRVFALPVDTGLEATVQLPTAARQREVVNGSLSVKDKLRNQPLSEVTISVIHKGLFPKVAHVVPPYLWDLPMIAEYVRQYGVPDEKRLNLMLACQTWDRLNWSYILADRPQPLPYKFQTQVALTGEVVSKTNGSDPPDSTVILTYLQKNTIGYEAEVVDGKFKVPFMFDFYDNDQVFCTLQSRSRILDADYRIKIIDDSIRFSYNWQSTETETMSVYGDYSLKHKLVANSYSFFGKKETQASANESPNRFFEDEFFGVDYTVNVQEYLIFPKMEEMLREIVPFVQHRKRGQTEVVRVLFRYEASTKLAKSDPLYIIDGAMSRNTAFFLSLKPENILYLKVLNAPNKLQQLGKLGENGIVFVESKRGTPAGIYERNIYDVVGVTRPRSFPYNENYHFGASGRVPDLRSALFWSPSTKTDRTGKSALTFSASDDVGPVLVRVEGFTEDGRPFFAEQEMTISSAASAKK